MAALTQDIRYALRTLAKSPGFTVLVVATLALGIGFNTAVFSVVDAAVLKPLAYARPGELVRIFDSNPGRGFDRFSASPPNFVDWRAQNTTLAGMAAFTGDDATLTAESARFAGAGLLAGLALAIAATRLLRTMLFGVEPTDPLSFAAVAFLLTAVTLAASWIPARRAARIDPIKALRHE